MSYEPIFLPDWPLIVFLVLPPLVSNVIVKLAKLDPEDDELEIAELRVLGVGLFFTVLPALILIALEGLAVYFNWGLVLFVFAKLAKDPMLEDGGAFFGVYIFYCFMVGLLSLAVWQQIEEEHYQREKIDRL